MFHNQYLIDVRSILLRLYYTLIYNTVFVFQFILVFNWIEYEPLTIGTYIYPAWANGVGWVIAFLPVAIIVFIALYKICITTKRPFREVSQT